MNPIEATKIAKFIGAKEYIDFNEFDMFGTIKTLNRDDEPFYKPVNMLFDSDWNWLMQVVERIEDITMGTITTVFLVYIHNNYCKIKSHPQWDYNMEIYENEIEADGESKIQAVYKAVVTFIDWYNENGAKEK